MEDGFLKSQGMPSPPVLNCVDVLLCWALPLRCFEFPFLFLLLKLCFLLYFLSILFTFSKLFTLYLFCYNDVQTYNVSNLTNKENVT